MDDVGENLDRDDREDDARSQMLEVAPSFGPQGLKGGNQGA